MENVVRAMARFDAIRASAPRPSPAPGFEAHLAAVTMATPTHTHAAPPSPAAAAVAPGVVAFAGERSGYGNVVHVDFEVRRDGEAVDSEPYLAGM